MRRTIRTLLVSGVLLSAAACGTATGPSGTPNVAGAPTAASGPAAAAPGALASTCEQLGQAYSTNIAALAESLTTLVNDRKAVAGAEASLTAFAGAVADATKGSDDAQIKADGKKAADTMRAKAADKKFFAGIKTAADVERTMGPTLTEWMSPVTKHCS